MTTTRTIMVGCPIRRRHWIMEVWREHLEAELARTPGLEFAGFQFVAAADDERTLAIVNEWPDTDVHLIEEPARADQRDWQPARLALMTGLRNSLLAPVRERDPDLFLSADSDMLLAPGTLAGMLELLDAHAPECWAVGGKAYMTPDGRDRQAPSFAMRSGRSFARSDSDQAGQVDVIMGLKLMTRPAYRTDYRYHRSGEDLGWCEAVHEAGGRLWWDGRTCSKHVMAPPWLYLIDPRVGF